MTEKKTRFCEQMYFKVHVFNSIFTFSKQSFNESLDKMQPFIASWTTQILIDSCQAHLPVQYASNIELIPWCCDWQRATLESHMQNKPLVCSIGCLWIFVTLPTPINPKAGCAPVFCYDTLFILRLVNRGPLFPIHKSGSLRGPTANTKSVFKLAVPLFNFTLRLNR